MAGRPERGLEVVLSGGARLLIDSPAHLDLAAALIRQLQSLQPC